MNWFWWRKPSQRVTILCPFHEEETPSCSVDLKAGTYLCFGCGKKGKVVDGVPQA
jgi:DNA primase